MVILRTSGFFDFVLTVPWSNSVFREIRSKTQNSFLARESETIYFRMLLNILNSVPQTCRRIKINLQLVIEGYGNRYLEYRYFSIRTAIFCIGVTIYRGIDSWLINVEMDRSNNSLLSKLATKTLPGISLHRRPIVSFPNHRFSNMFSQVWFSTTFFS